MNKSLLVALPLLLMSTFTVPAYGESASQLKQRGNTSMESGRPADALDAYQRAYDIEPDPSLLYNMGRAHMALTDYPAALQLLLRFEKEASPTLKSRVPGLAGMIQELRGRITTVIIETNVDGATVRLGPNVLGSTPMTEFVQVNAGQVMLEVTKEGYLPHKEKVDLDGGKTTTLKVRLEPMDTHGSVEIRSPEPAVRVLLDGRFRGMVPLELRLPAGQYQIELRKDGFEPVSTQIVVRAGKRGEVTIPIEAKPKLYERWWFWTGIGVAAAGAVTAVIVYNKEKEPDSGTIPPGRVTVDLRF